MPPTMKTTILNQRAERDELMSRPYQLRQTRYNANNLLGNPLIKLITGPRRVGKSVFALLMLRGRNFAYLNFDDSQLLDKWDEDLAMSVLDDVYPGYDFMLLDEVQNLPEPAENILYIVSALVLAASKRADLVAPATGHPEAVRNEKGQIVSVPGFVR